MNKQSSPAQRDPSARLAGSHGPARAWFILGSVTILLLALLLAAPVLAANQPQGAIEQGTVPPPVPMPTDDDDDDDDERPTATPTRAPMSNSAGSAPASNDSVASEQAETTVAPANYAGVVTGARLNVRQGPGMGFAVLGRLFQDESVVIQYRDDTSAWWYTCCISGTTTSGWVSADFIQPEFPRNEAATLLPPYPELGALPTSAPVASPVAVATRAPVSGALMAVVDAQPRLNLRQAASASSAIVGKIADGQQVEVSARNAAGDWWYICCVEGTDTAGWASAAFLVPDFAADANSLLPVQDSGNAGGGAALLPTATPRPRPIITPRPKVLNVPPTPIAVNVPAAATTAAPTPIATTPAPQTPAATPEPALEPTAEPTPLSSAPTTLRAMMWQEPAFPMPGDTILLRYAITNTGSAPATQVEVRNELPAELALGQGAGSDNALFTQEATDAGNTVYALLWDVVPAGASVSATVAVTLADALPASGVLHNLAAIGAANSEGQTAGVTISAPPVMPPDFQ